MLWAQANDNILEKILFLVMSLEYIKVCTCLSDTGKE